MGTCSPLLLLRQMRRLPRVPARLHNIDLPFRIAIADGLEIEDARGGILGVAAAAAGEAEAEDLGGAEEEAAGGTGDMDASYRNRSMLRTIHTRDRRARKRPLPEIPNRSFCPGNRSRSIGTEDHPRALLTRRQAAKQ